ncbi:MAG: hypothetical protein KME05_22490 [Gloeocapsa sp. UFS-A4-WI-NPMV-4B04]|nr:hypothetical protein [Gloeocapsa sp. UFS-A4-WI-NPMV-4B04]
MSAGEQDTPDIRKQRDDYRQWLDQVDVRNLVFIDEAGVHLGMVPLERACFSRGTSHR